MDERYEIRGKLGQGGLGAVYRAFDSRMNRDVAIKRIVENGDDALKKEASEQLQQEAGALASLQHPNIVTVYDVDRDDEGSYVVMELITGKTLDELVENAPLTFDDFKDLAKQIQEGLIAAQELGLVHRDLKPGNLMLNWLPSGKFQAKIVDFGLARLLPKPAVEALGDNDSIFGSIYFMAPEQFERGLIDTRVDMYAIGCVYYHALSGEYPFTGETGPEVMAAHLNHWVVPLDEVRPDLPKWLTDWIMWHINRLPNDRPDNARHSLQVFLLNENAPPPPKPKVITHAVGLPMPKLAGGKPRIAVRIHTGPLDSEPIAKTQSAPKSLTPPEGFGPSVHTSTVYVGGGSLPTQDAAQPTPTKRSAGPQPVAARTVPVPPSKPKKQLKKSEKAALWIAVLLITIFIAFVVYKLGGK